jgi:hypothetical protein
VDKHKQMHKEECSLRTYIHKLKVLHTYIHTYMHYYFHTYIHTYIYIHTHTYIHEVPLVSTSSDVVVGDNRLANLEGRQVRLPSTASIEFHRLGAENS